MNWNPTDRAARHRFLDARLALLAGRGVLADVLRRSRYDDPDDRYADILEIEISDFECGSRDDEDDFDEDDEDEENVDDEDEEEDADDDGTKRRSQ